MRHSADDNETPVDLATVSAPKDIGARTTPPWVPYAAAVTVGVSIAAVIGILVFGPYFVGSELPLIPDDLTASSDQNNALTGVQAAEAAALPSETPQGAVEAATVVTATPRPPSETPVPPTDIASEPTTTLALPTVTATSLFPTRTPYPIVSTTIPVTIDAVPTTLPMTVEADGDADGRRREGLRAQFIYNEDAFYWMNRSNRNLRAADISFERIGGEGRFAGNQWAYHTVERRRCMEIHFVEVSNLPRPDGCNPNAIFTPARRETGSVFWTGTGQFRVLWRGEEIAVCEIAAGECEATIPRG